MDMKPGTILAERDYDRLVLLRASLCDERDAFDAATRIDMQTALFDRHDQVVITDNGATITLSKNAFATLIEAHQAHVADQEKRHAVTVVNGDDFDPFLDTDELP